jgi:L-cysteine:1D-myo-inositol 2-amino-2-deoxy-alpha-D-glucopyranoside ligase
LRIFDTSRGKVVAFEPAAGPGGTVTMYTCGITPYDAAHIGHAATYLAYDVLQRRLRDLGYRTMLVRNVTDVDDDILRKARQLGVHYLDLAAEEMARFSADMDALGLLGAASEPRATSAIPDILGFIGMVLANGHAYQAGGAVYFDVSSWPAFGSISHYGRDTMLELARERGGNPDDPNKADPLDFVLWQPAAPGEPAWDSLWGRGRPGWHIECSALVVRELGVTIDLHGGGSDLIFPHHECEAAQSQAATGELFVRHWMHTGMVGYEGTKMSKSLGNLVFVRDLLKSWDPGAIRLAILANHYRSDWEWRDDLLVQGQRRLAVWRAGYEGAGSTGQAPGHPRSAAAPAGDRLVAAATPIEAPAPRPDQRRGRDLLDEVREALDDDLATPRALVAIDRVAGAAAGVPPGDPLHQCIADAAALLGVAL